MTSCVHTWQNPSEGAKGKVQLFVVNDKELIYTRVRIRQRGEAWWGSALMKK